MESEDERLTLASDVLHSLVPSLSHGAVPPLPVPTSTGCDPAVGLSSALDSSLLVLLFLAPCPPWVTLTLRTLLPPSPSLLSLLPLVLRLPLPPSPPPPAESLREAADEAHRPLGPKRMGPLAPCWGAMSQPLPCAWRDHASAGGRFARTIGRDGRSGGGGAGGGSRGEGEGEVRAEGGRDEDASEVEDEDDMAGDAVDAREYDDGPRGGSELEGW